MKCMAALSQREDLEKSISILQLWSESNPIVRKSWGKRVRDISATKIQAVELIAQNGTMQIACFGSEPLLFM